MTKCSSKQRRKLKARAMTASPSRPDEKLEAVMTISSSKQDESLKVPETTGNSSIEKGKLGAPAMTTGSSKHDGELEVRAMTTNASQKDGTLTKVPAMTASSSNKKGKSRLEEQAMTAGSSEQKGKSKLGAQAATASSYERKGKWKVEEHDATTIASSSKQKDVMMPNVMTPTSTTGMGDLPDDVLAIILLRVPLEDKKNITLVSWRWYELDRDFTEKLTVGPGLVPPQAALAAISDRYCNIETLKIAYTRRYDAMEQIDDASLRCLSKGLENLIDLSLIGCTNVTDVGIANIALCLNLSAVHLKGIRRMTGRGLLWLVKGCVDTLELLQITQLHAVRDLEWLKFIGAQGNIKYLAIEECREILEPWLYKLGPRGWANLRTLSFSSYGRRKPLAMDAWKFDGPAGTEYCPNLEVLSLSHCVAVRGTGMSWILAQCKALRRVDIFDCAGIGDTEMRVITKNNPQLSSIYLGSQCPSAPKLTSEMLVAIAECCPRLENLKLVSRTMGPRTLESGLVTLVRSCTQLKTLSLGSFSGLGKRTMVAINRSTSLEDVEFAACDDLPDGVVLSLGPKVTRLSLLCCPSLTGKCLSGFGVSRPALSYLQIYSMPSIATEAALSAAEVLRYWYTDRHDRFAAVLKGTDSVSDPAAEDFFVERSLKL